MSKTTIIATLAALMMMAGYPADLKAQEAATSKRIDGQRFILPTIELLTRYIDQDFNDWAAEMERGGFSPLTESTDTPIYRQGKIGRSWLLIDKDTSGLVSYNWFTYHGEESLCGEFLRWARPYHIQTGDGIRYHRYRHWLIGTKQESGGGLYTETIWIIDLANAEQLINNTSSSTEKQYLPPVVCDSSDIIINDSFKP